MKLRRKLLSAGFALGATALTLTTSTFAWYTANTDVEAGSVSGITSTTADTGSFYIAAADTYGTDGSVSTVTTYTNSAFPYYVGTGTSSTTGLILNPVSYVDNDSHVRQYVPMTSVDYTYTSVAANADFDEDETYYTESAGVYTKANITEFAAETTYYTRSAKKNKAIYGSFVSKSTNVYEWVYRFRTAATGASVSLYFKDFSLTTNKKAEGYKDIQSLVHGDGTGISSTGVYFADLAKSLKLTIAETPMTNLSTLGNTTTVNTFSLAAWATAADDNIDSTGGANAVGYYNAALGTAISKPTSYDSEKAGLKTGTAYPFATIPSDSGYVEVRFTLWLDGWDEYCYDVMRQQEFTLSFDVSSIAQTANTLTGTAAQNNG